MYFTCLSTAKGLSESAIGTAEFLNFFDKLFDSLNGPTRHTEKGQTADDEIVKKPLRGAVTVGSVHHEFWAKALKVLDSITFIHCHGEEKT